MSALFSHGDQVDGSATHDYNQFNTDEYSDDPYDVFYLWTRPLVNHSLINQSFEVISGSTVEQHPL